MSLRGKMFFRQRLGKLRKASRKVKKTPRKYTAHTLTLKEKAAEEEELLGCAESPRAKAAESWDASSALPSC